jgi:N-acetylglucosamine kinase-like BadF-type ATPase
MDRLTQLLLDVLKHTAFSEVKKSVDKINDDEGFRSATINVATRWLETLATIGITRENAMTLDADVLRLIARSAVVVDDLAISAIAYTILELQGEIAAGEDKS